MGGGAQNERAGSTTDFSVRTTSTLLHYATCVPEHGSGATESTAAVVVSGGAHLSKNAPIRVETILLKQQALAQL